MKVVSRLVNMDFKIGKMARKDDQLLITSHPSQPMQVKVYLDPEDVISFIRAALNWSVISYIFTLPFRRSKHKKETRTASSSK